MATLKEGDNAPNFALTDNEGKLHSLNDYSGEKLIIFFYPRANTPGCTAEACNLRDYFKDLKDKGYSILGVSADSEKSQQSFSKKYDFPFPLLADIEKVMINAYGVWGPKKFRGKEYEGIIRKTFLVDEKGIITRIIDKVKTKDHAAQILET
tara:strand:- start:464 stop:919 length:456 start_codon:yes stop_codon:yes gene_type:complete